VSHDNSVQLPEGWSLWSGDKRGYMTIANADGHPIAGLRGRIPYHRYLLFEHLGRPEWTQCFWCGFSLPWRVGLPKPTWHVINVDHIDGNPKNNELSNLVPSCAWCNCNRSWAQPFESFWKNWRKWLAQVPPIYRPNLIDIATDFGIEPAVQPRWEAA
jgi:hypothetical protein